MSKPVQKCTICQGDFTKKDGKLLCWVKKGKEEIKMCCACKEKFEKQGNSETLSLEFSDPGMEGGWICGICCKQVKECHKKAENGKTIIKHDCQPKCGITGSAGIGNCEKTWKYTQVYADLLHKHGKKFLHYSKCHDCQIKEIRRNESSGNTSWEEDKEFVKELEKLFGKDNNDNSERERERERERDKIEVRDCWFRKDY